MNNHSNIFALTSVMRLLVIILSVSYTSLLLASDSLSSTSNLDKEELMNAESLVSLTRGSTEFSCIDCHGKTGNSIHNIKYEKQTPRLAGQDMSYLYSQLINFKQGARFANEMEGILQYYSNQELQLIAHYFASQTLSKDPKFDVTLDTLTHSKAEDESWSKQGESLYLNGDSRRDILACQTCHGKFGEGRIIGLDKAPKLTGQHARYVRMTLENYAKGQRTTDKLFNNPMQTISRKLTPLDRRNLAAYIQGLSSPN